MLRSSLPQPLTTPALVQTPRLLLRPYVPADAADFFTLLDQERPRLQPSFPARSAAVRALPDAHRILTTFAHDWQSHRLYVLGIWEASTTAYVGDISLKPNWATPITLEIGYYLASRAEGQGYAREALQAAVTFGFGVHTTVERLLIRCRASNPRSCAVAEHAGFRLLAPRSRLWPLRWPSAGGTEDIHSYLLRRPA